MSSTACWLLSILLLQLLLLLYNLELLRINKERIQVCTSTSTVVRGHVLRTTTTRVTLPGVRYGTRNRAGTLVLVLRVPVL
jgi:hypothetical protein